MQTRLYEVSYIDNGQVAKRLVDAGSPAQAIRHCVKDKYRAIAASPKTVAELMGAGQAIEKAAATEEVTQTGTAHN